MNVYINPSQKFHFGIVFYYSKPLVCQRPYRDLEKWEWRKLILSDNNQLSFIPRKLDVYVGKIN